jgi:hypothetical protein
MQDNIIEIVKAYYDKLAAAGPVEAAAQTISDDFRLIAGTVEMGRMGFIDIMTLLYTAIPDLSHALSDIQVRGEVVQLTDRLMGTFTGPWDGSKLGLPVIPPNGNAFFMAPLKWEVTVRHGKITRWHDVTVPSAQSGLPGFLKALGQ